MPSASCSIDGCDRDNHMIRGMCNMHYKRLRKRGEAGPPEPLVGTPEQRFQARIDKRPDGCWHWTGSLGSDGYGRLSVDGKNLLAHRLSYEFSVGPIPDGLVIDHLCRNRACVNPGHLEPVTHQTNILRGAGEAAIHASKTHCVNGHDLADAYRTPKGHRRCRTCIAINQGWAHAV